MESLIRLGIDKFEIDWGKYLRDDDYRDLFPSKELKQIDSFAYDDFSESVVPTVYSGYTASLSSVKARLDILGFDLKSCEEEYNDSMDFYKSLGYSFDLPFQSFARALCSLDVASIDTIETEADGGSDFELGEYVRDCVLKAPIFMDFIGQKDEMPFGIRLVSEFLENLNPRIIMRLLAENPQNLDKTVVWMPSTELLSNLMLDKEPLADRIMIVTEGTSDLNILKRTIDTLYPDISDLFDYIDMEDNYPFTGNGSLKNFCIGLDRIKISNNVIVLFDNDSAGNESYSEVKDKCHCDNMVILTLPDHSSFDNFCTVGPQGTTNENINGRAVAIECFLDLMVRDCTPRVRWKSYIEKSGQYQGALESKERYQKDFYKSDLIDGSYNTEKLKYLINYIIDQWINR